MTATDANNGAPLIDRAVPIADDLITRVEAGTGPDCELDARIVAAIEGRDLREGVNWQNRPVLLGRRRDAPHDECVMCWLDSRDVPAHVPSLASSFDACLSLFDQKLPGWVWLKKAPGVASVYRPSEDGSWARHFDGSALSDTRALLAAMLRAVNAVSSGLDGQSRPHAAIGEEAAPDQVPERCAALLSLATSGIRPDIQELLVQGNPMQSVPPGALWKAIDAFNAGGKESDVPSLVNELGPVTGADKVRQPASFVAIPSEPSDGVLMSIAIRLDHGLGVPGYYDQEIFAQSGATHARRLQVALDDARRAYEEIVGSGFYRPDLEEWYRARKGDGSTS